MSFCSICGKTGIEANHKCDQRVLNAIDAANKLAEEAETNPERRLLSDINPPYGRRLSNGFEMMRSSGDMDQD